jgi:two-component system alkaline phosphatase synthesis response regulator PhoP
MPSILLVEDDDLLQDLYKRVLSLSGYQVLIAKDGEEGIRMMKQDKPGLVLLDIMMPKLDGLGMLKVIREDPDVKSIPVLVLTNLAGEEYAKKALELGALKYIIKSNHQPFEIIEMIKQYLPLV